MPNYRCRLIPSGTLFFTVMLGYLLTDHIDDLHAVFADTRRRPPLVIDAVVVLLNHLHCIWMLTFTPGYFSRKQLNRMKKPILLGADRTPILRIWDDFPFC